MAGWGANAGTISSGNAVQYSRNTISTKQQQDGTICLDHVAHVQVLEGNNEMWRIVTMAVKILGLAT